MKYTRVPSVDQPWPASAYLPDVSAFAFGSGDVIVASVTHTCGGRSGSFHPPPFARYTARRDDAHVALGAPRRSFFSKSSGLVVLENAIFVPSGDHDRRARAFRQVRQRGRFPAAERDHVNLRRLPRAARTNASRLPSGDNRGDESRVPDVSARGASWPSLGTIHKLVS